MTLILILAFVLIAFILLLRYDIHKHKYRDGLDKPADDATTPAEKPKSNAKNKH